MTIVIVMTKMINLLTVMTKTTNIVYRGLKRWLLKSIWRRIFKKNNYTQTKLFIHKQIYKITHKHTQNSFFRWRSWSFKLFLESSRSFFIRTNSEKVVSMLVLSTTRFVLEGEPCPGPFCDSYFVCVHVAFFLWNTTETCCINGQVRIHRFLWRRYTTSVRSQWRPSINSCFVQSSRRSNGISAPSFPTTNQLWASVFRGCRESASRILQMT